jgi:hypothetical protein
MLKPLKRLAHGAEDLVPNEIPRDNTLQMESKPTEHTLN